MVSFSGVKSLVAFPTFGECFLLCSRSTRIPRFPNLNAESPSDIHVWHGYVWVTTNTPQAQGIGPPTSNPNTSWPLKVRNSVGKSVGDKFGHVKNAWFGTRLWISIHQESCNIFTYLQQMILFQFQKCTPPAVLDDVYPTPFWCFASFNRLSSLSTPSRETWLAGKFSRA